MHSDLWNKMDESEYIRLNEDRNGKINTPLVKGGGTVTCEMYVWSLFVFLGTHS